LVQKGHGDMRENPLSGWTTDSVLQAASQYVSRRTVRPRPQRQTTSRNGVTPPSRSALVVPSRCPPHAGVERDGLRSKGLWESHGIGRQSPGAVEGRGVSSSGDAMTTVATSPMDRWNVLPWKKFQRQVFKLQKRIYVRHESRVPVDETPRLRSTPPGTPSSLSPRNRVSSPRLRRQYVRTSVECKARTPEHWQPQSVNGQGENCSGLTPVNRRRVRYALPGESGLIHPNQNGAQGGCLSVDGDNRGTVGLPDQRRSPTQLQVRYTEHGKPYEFSGRGQSRLTVRKAEVLRG
jgi:hypothetical protein